MNKQAKELPPLASNELRTAPGEDLIVVSGLRKSFGPKAIYEGLDLEVRRGENLTVIGGSGTGKSVMLKCLIGLLSPDEGSIRFDGTELLELGEEEMRSIRGNRISMIFQQPTTCLNPVFKVGDQIVEALQIHQGLNLAEARKRTIELLALVGLPDPARRANQYPHELSGGQCQRVMIAMALACNPELLIADEPTTALDVTIQAQILDLMRGLREKVNTAIILITHDMGVVAEMCDTVAVMYAGQIVEYADVRQLFTDPKHPYTQGLLASIPVLGELEDELATIPGTVPSLVDPPPGCRFKDRCAFRFDRCDEDVPLFTLEGGRQSRCWLHEAEAIGKK